MLETLIKEAGHECIFLPKFHCELNPIEMVCEFQLHLQLLTLKYSTGAGLSTATVKFKRKPSKIQNRPHLQHLVNVGHCVAWHIRVRLYNFSSQ